MRTATFVFAILASSSLSSQAFAQASPSPFTSATRYDDLRRVTGTISPDPGGGGSAHYLAVRNTYDAAGRLITVETGELTSWQPEYVAPTAWSGFTPFHKRETTYDGVNRKVKESLSSGGTTYQVTQYSYDTLGRLECTALRMNPAAFGSLPANACDLGVEGTQGPDRITRNVYDAADQLLSVQKAYGTPLQQTYVAYGYSSNGKQTSVLDGNGNLATYAYDGFDRRVRWNFPSQSTSGTASSTDYEEYTYDPQGNRTALRKRDGRTFSFGYDALNRMTSKIVPDACVSGYVCTSAAPSATRDVYYGYDLRGLQISARFDSASGADAIIDTYDGFGRRKSSTTAMGGVVRTLGFLYDADNNRIRVSHPDGNYFTYDYDGLNRPSGIKENGSAQVVAWAWDIQGRRSGESRGGVTSSYGYDPVSQLNSLSDDLAGTADDVVSTFGYNSAGQIISRTRSNDGYAFNGYVDVSRTYATNRLNQYTSAGGVGFTYDANGDLMTNGSTTYTYDAENRLVAASTGANLIYDPLGRLYQISGGGAGIARFLYDGDALVEETNNAGTLLRRYVHGTGDDDPLLWYEGSGLATRKSMQVDHQGSIISIADSSGTSTGIYRYDEFGIPGGAYPGRFQYTGQAYIAELGMYYYKGRIYSPTLGRFLQIDPVGYDDHINLYTYVTNDPVNLIDPSGERLVTAGERQMLMSVFGTTMDTNRRVFSNGVSSPIPRQPEIFQYNAIDGVFFKRNISWGNAITMTKAFYSNDYSSTPNTALVNTFWHEFYHEFEYRIGISRPTGLFANQAMGGFGNGIYAYDASKTFMQNNPEARADYFAGCITTGICSALNGLNAKINATDTLKFANGKFALYRLSTGSRIPQRIN